MNTTETKGLKFKRRVIKFLGITVHDEQVPDGWEDLGEKEAWNEMRGSQVFKMTPVHTFCGTHARIGRTTDKGVLFQYCPRCGIFIQFSNGE